MIYTLTNDDALDLWFATYITEICFGAERTINSTDLITATSASGTKLTSQSTQLMSTLRDKADVA